MSRSDTIYRNYDLLAKWDGNGASDLRWAGLRSVGEPAYEALKRLGREIADKYHIHMTDVAILQLLCEFVVWEKIHEGEIREWPTRHPERIKALHEENERAKKQAGAP
jgi:hypothetical protein